jgi:hypothetical protein
MNVVSRYAMTANRMRERCEKHVDGRGSNTGRPAEEVKNIIVRATVASTELSSVSSCFTYKYLDSGALAAFVQKYVFDLHLRSGHDCLCAPLCVFRASVS